MIFGEKDSRFSIDTKFVCFSESDQIRSHIEYKLLIYCCDNNSWNFLQKTIFDNLDDKFHIKIISNYRLNYSFIFTP